MARETTTPTEEGWYWYRENDGAEWMPVQVWLDCDEGLHCQPFSGFVYDLRECNDWEWGPRIQSPDEAREAAMRGTHAE